ncbi:c-type cytochrome [Mesorhizobium sp. 43Arga]
MDSREDDAKTSGVRYAMGRSAALVVLLLATAAPVLTVARAASVTPPKGDATSGRGYFEDRCTGCHSIARNGFGPRLGDVYGRRVGSVAGFQYSQALRQKQFVWSEKSLDSWLSGPGQFLPGSRMGMSIGDQQIRADIIAYLRSHPSGQDE